MSLAEKYVSLHVYFSDIYISVFICPLQRGEGMCEGIHHTLHSPIAGWLMNRSTHHAASVIYQENDNPFPAPNPNTHCSQLPAFMTVRLYDWE